MKSIKNKNIKKIIKTDFKNISISVMLNCMGTYISINLHICTHEGVVVVSFSVSPSPSSLSVNKKYM